MWYSDDPIFQRPPLDWNSIVFNVLWSHWTYALATAHYASALVQIDSQLRLVEATRSRGALSLASAALLAAALFVLALLQFLRSQGQVRLDGPLDFLLLVLYRELAVFAGYVIVAAGHLVLLLVCLRYRRPGTSGGRSGSIRLE